MEEVRLHHAAVLTVAPSGLDQVAPAARSAPDALPDLRAERGATLRTGVPVAPRASHGAASSSVKESRLAAPHEGAPQRVVPRLDAADQSPLASTASPAATAPVRRRTGPISAAASHQLRWAVRLDGQHDGQEQGRLRRRRPAGTARPARGATRSRAGGRRCGCCRRSRRGRRSSVGGLPSRTSLPWPSSAAVQRRGPRPDRVLARGDRGPSCRSCPRRRACRP